MDVAIDERKVANTERKGHRVYCIILSIVFLYYRSLSEHCRSSYEADFTVSVVLLLSLIAILFR